MRTKEGLDVTLENMEFGYQLKVTGLIKVQQVKIIDPYIIETASDELLAAEIKIVSEQVRERMQWLLARDAEPRVTPHGPTN